MIIARTPEEILKKVEDEYKDQSICLKSDFREKMWRKHIEGFWIRFVDEDDDTYGEVFNLDFPQDYKTTNMIKYVLMERELLYTVSHETIQIPYKAIITDGVERHNKINKII